MPWSRFRMGSDNAVFVVSTTKSIVPLDSVIHIDVFGIESKYLNVVLNQPFVV